MLEIALVLVSATFWFATFLMVLDNAIWAIGCWKVPLICRCWKMPHLSLGLGSAIYTGAGECHVRY